MSSWRLGTAANGRRAGEPDQGGHIPQVITLEMRYLHMTNYNFLVVDPGTRDAVIVDPAWQMDKIDAALAGAQARLRGILVTHSHPDHVHLARPLARKYDVPIWMSNEEIAASGFEADRLIGIDSRAWWIGNLRIVPLLTPGHTPGCVCYLIGDNLFSGDVLFAEGCGMCPDVKGAHEMFASLEYLKKALKPQTRVFPGHSYGKYPGQPFAQVLRDNIYLQIPDKHMFAAFRLRKTQRIPNKFGQ